MENIKAQFDYENILPKGKENAVSAAALAEKLGFHSVRMLQKDLEKAGIRSVDFISNNRRLLSSGG